MQFSKKVAQLARTYNLDPKDVLYAMLITSGASVAESFAIIYRPPSSSNAALVSRASQYTSQRPALARLIEQIDMERARTQQTNQTDTTQHHTKRGRPRKAPISQPDDAPSIDYRNKDVLLQELAKVAERSEKDSDKLSAFRTIAELQRMKQEQDTAAEKTVYFYIPLDYDKAEELRAYLAKYYADEARKSDGSAK